MIFSFFNVYTYRVHKELFSAPFLKSRTPQLAFNERHGADWHFTLNPIQCSTTRHSHDAANRAIAATPNPTPAPRRADHRRGFSPRRRNMPRLPTIGPPAPHRKAAPRTPPRNGRPRRPPPIFPPRHRRAVLSECRDSCVPFTGRSILGSLAVGRADRPRAGPFATLATARYAPPPPAPEVRAALAPLSRALSRSPRTTPASRSPCPPPPPPPY